jgi:hypothetical protein
MDLEKGECPMKMSFCVAIALLSASVPYAAQKQTSKDTLQGLVAQDKPRLYLTDRDSWKESGWVAAANGNAAGGISGRVVREHTENVRTFNKACTGVTVTENKEKADFALVWDRTNWNETAWSGYQNNMAIYNRDGDLVWSGASHKMTTGAKDACKAVLQAAAQKGTR